MKVIVIGNGEVGSALIKLLSENNEVDYTDLNHKAKGQFDIMCVAIPYSDSFIQTIKDYQKEYNPKSTIIFSSVAIGTSRELNAIHTPVEGIHPELYQSLKTFPRFVGGYNKIGNQFLKDNFETVLEISQPEYTEFLKLRSTTLYGLNIEFARYTKEVTDTLGMLYDWVKLYDIAYNDFYKEMGHPEYSRYILYPPKDNGIKGHCVLENAIILYKKYPDNILLSVLSLGKNKEVIKEEKIFLNDTWLWCEYWGKRKTLKEIGKELGVTGEWIGKIMKDKGIPKREIKWTQEEINQILEFVKEGKNFKEISKIFNTHTYNAIRNLAYKELDIKSSYNPAIRELKTRKKISATLQGITIEEWNGFKETINALQRKSIAYKKWREAVFKRDNYTCQRCNVKSGNGKTIYLHAHHIKKFSKYPKLRFDIQNGQTLCINCHKLAHKRIK